MECDYLGKPLATNMAREELLLDTAAWHKQFGIITLYYRGLKLKFIRGPHFNKKELGHIRSKNVYAGRKRG